MKKSSIFSAFSTLIFITLIFTSNIQPTPQKFKAINPAPAKSKGKIFRHPTGFRFWYPEKWKFVPLEGIVQISPPDSGNTQETFEYYFVTGEDISMEAITQPNSPSVIMHMDQQMSELGTTLGIFFQRMGQPQELDISVGKGKPIKMEWQAQSRLGKIRAQAYISICKHYGCALVAIGSLQRLQKGEKVALKIFKSIGVEEGKWDPALVGTWSLRKETGITNQSPFETDWSRAQLAAENQSTLQFMANGRWHRVDDYHMVVGAGDVWLEDKDRKESRGKWNAEKGLLFMLWEDQSFEDYQYHIRGKLLILTSKEKRLLWERQR